MKLLARFLSIVCLASAAGLSSPAAIINWTGVISSDWNNPTNWTPQQVPTASDHAVVSSNSVTVPPSAVFAILDTSGGSVSGSIMVATNAVLNWMGGQIGNGTAG